MTEREKIEREIILDILAESSKWRITEDDQDVDCIRLEVMDRARRLLLGVETIDGTGRAQSHPENLTTESDYLTDADYQTLEAAKLDEHLASVVNEHIASVAKVNKALCSWKSKRVRCQENGRSVWHLRSDCIKAPRDNSNGGLPWTWKYVGPRSNDSKQEQCDAMWAEHEKESNP